MSDELDFGQTLSQMAEMAKQLELLNMIRKIVRFIQSNQNLCFRDLLRALARYTAIEYAKEEGNNPDWDVIGVLLHKAASTVETSSPKSNDRPLPLELEVQEQFTNYYRHSLLLNMVTLWAKCLEKERCRFADILKILSEYAQCEADELNGDDKLSWNLAASIIYSAYEKAQCGNIP
jgi:hypothetical protein